MKTNLSSSNGHHLMTLAHTTSTSQPLLSTSYTYDALGNRLTRTDSPSVPPEPVLNGAVMTSTYDVANRMLTSPDTTYTYDNNGNTLTKADSTGTTTYGYDYENRLTSVSDPGGLTVSYAYDPFGRRISKTVNGVTTQYLYDGMNIVKEYDGIGTLLATYVHGPGIDEPISMTRGGQTSYYHADGLGSITGLTDSTQTLVQNYNYDGFGNLTQTPTVQNPYTYTGREWDAETGLYYYRARSYEPKVGRFLQQDPIGFKGGINFYAYVLNNPINLTDPMGLKGCGNCTKAGSLPSSSPKCDSYGNGTYMGASLKCFCKCAGDSAWSQQVRGCLACEYDNGTDLNTAHKKCYDAAGWGSAPWGTLRVCYAKCFKLGG